MQRIYIQYEMKAGEGVTLACGQANRRAPFDSKQSKETAARRDDEGSIFAPSSFRRANGVRAALNFNHTERQERTRIYKGDIMSARARRLRARRRLTEDYFN